MGIFRTLRADEIECRVSSINEKGLQLLLYKDARVDQKLLDEVFGVFGWQRTHQLIGDRLYCTVTVKDPDTGEWISKQDVGTESYTEKEKGQASDSFKRACFNLGIGRELYTAPFIWIPAGQYKAVNRNGKTTTYDRFSVSAIEITEGRITFLEVVNASQKNSIVFVSGRRAGNAPERKSVENVPPSTEKPLKRISEKQVMTLKIMCKRHNDMPEEHVAQKYGKAAIEELTIDDWADFSRTGQELLAQWDEAHQV